MNPSHSSQPAVQQAALPSSASASGFFVTHSDVSLTSVKVTQDEDQSMEPDLSGCAFLGQEANPVQKVEEEGVAFHTENQNATNCGNPRSWMYKSYGLEECCQRLL